MVSVMLSRLRWAVSTQLAKGYFLGVDIPVSRIIGVFGLNSGLVYRFLRELEGEGIVERVGRGRYRVVDSYRGRVWAEYIASTVKITGYSYFQEAVPEVYYYIAEPPSMEWLGFPERILMLVDEKLKERLSPPSKYIAVYKSLRGRRWRYDWSLRVSRAVAEQALADLLSYDPNYPAEQYIYLNMDSIDLDEVARRSTLEGLKRLSTFLAYLRISTGKPIATRFNYISLADRSILEERLGEYTTLIFANGIDIAGGI
jgi:hypothetical protein